MLSLNVVRNGGISNWFRLLIQCKSTNIDVLDVFTTRILSKKIPTPIKSSIQSSTTTEDKYRAKNFMKIKLYNQNKTESKMISNIDNLHITHWSEAELDHNLIVSMDCDDRKLFDRIIEQMLTSKRLPSDTVIMRLLCHLCDDNDKSMNTISHLIDVCQEMNLTFYASNLDFAPFLSQYLWKLQRFDDALNTLNTMFGVTNKNSKSLILRNYRQIIYDAVKNQDESIVDKVIAHAIKINNQYKDSILIVYAWSDCFYSELFRNQQKAEELFTAFDVIRTTIIPKDIGWIALTLLQQHNIDAIHRLIEQCLGANLKKEVGVCLTALFDYHYWRNDLRSCTEVMNTSIRLGTPMSNTQNQKLIDLLLKKTQKTQLKTSPIKPAGSRFEFKF